MNVILPVIIVCICLSSQGSSATRQDAAAAADRAVFYNPEKAKPASDIVSDSSVLLKSSPKAVNKKYSNKEFLYGDDDDDSNEEAEAKLTSKEADLKNSEMFMPLVKPEFETQSVKQQTEQDDSSAESYLPNLDDLNDLNDEELTEFLLAMYTQDQDHLHRAQRTDVKHSMHDKFVDRLTKFHKNGQLQKEIANMDSSDSGEYEVGKSSIDYDDIINRLKGNTDQFETDMNAGEMGSILSDLKLVPPKYAKLNSPNLFENLNDEEEMKNFNFGSMGSGDLNGLGDLINKLKLSSTQLKGKGMKQKPVFDFNEKIYSEKDYNKQQFKTASVLSANNNKLVNLEKSNIFNSDLFKDINLNLDSDLMKLTNSMNSQAAAALAAPSMVKQSSFGVKVQDPDEQTNSFNAKINEIKKQNDYLFVFIVAGCILAGLVALIAASVCWYTVNRNIKAATANVEYGVKTPGLFNNPIVAGSNNSIKSNASKNSGGDRRLAQSAQMYHYQHQKQQMIAMEKANNDNKPDNSDNSDGETEEGDYTVYECPGLAPTGEMEVKNPLFKEDFGQSSNNLHTSESITSMPPSYSTINNNSEAKAATAVTPAKVDTQVQIVEPTNSSTIVDEQKPASETK